jgi:predicted DNA binding protein
MRRLILELEKEEAYENTTTQLKNIRTLDQLQLLRQDREEIAMICRVEFEEEVSSVEDFIKHIDDNIVDVKLLEQERTGAYIVFVKIKLSGSRSSTFSLVRSEGGYVVSREVRDGKIKVTYVGSAIQIRKMLDEVKRWGRHYRIISLTDAKFSIDSPLNTLTEKQREVLIASYKLGYYDLPRRISTEQLAIKLNLHKSALATHRRKAELRILSQILEDDLRK